jgi:superfamily II DNA or RNA helicase
MISEGVDIPRAACLAWMTSYRTPLFFAQAVGRVVRSRRPGEAATVFLPAVRPLLALAAEMEEQRNHVMPPAKNTDGHDLDPLPPLDENAVDVGGWEALSAEAEFAHVLESGRAVIPTRVAENDDDHDYLGLPGLLTAEQTATLLARRDAAHRRKASDTDQDALFPTEPAWKSTDGLRKEISAMVGQLSARTGDPHATVHAKLRDAVPGPPSAAAPEGILAARRDWLLERLTA